MIYRARSTKLQSDSNFISDIGKGSLRASSKIFPLFSPIIYLYDYIISTFAFISRSFLRVKLGSRSFGVFTFIFLLLFTWIALYYKEVYSLFLKDWLIESNHQENNLMENLGIYFIASFAAFIGMFAVLIGIITTNDTETIIIPEFNLPVIVLISFTFIWFVFHLRDVKRRKKTREIIHSQYRGDSLLFDWIEGKKIIGTVMTPEKIWLIIEPISILSLSAFLWVLTSWDDLSYLLMISGVCLFLEEYKIHKENKELEQNLVDQLLDGKYYAYIQQEVQDKLKYSEKMFFQENHRASFNKRNPVERRNADTQLGNSQYRARIL